MTNATPVTSATPEPSVPDHPKGRGLVWTGIGLALFGVVLYASQIALKQLTVPWYVPIMSTVGALLLLRSVTLHRGIVRIMALGVVGLLAASEWYFLVSLAMLPAYVGPAQAGQEIPTFRTTLADGRPFTDQDLRDGTGHVLSFFRGRW